MTAGARVLAVLIILAAGAALAAPAWGAEDPREVQGRALYAKGEYQAALDIYATLFAEKADPLYLRNIGRCNQKLRRPDLAIDAFREYLRRARRLKPAERQDVEGFIKEMEELRAQMASEREKAAQAAAPTPPPPAAVEAPPPPPAAASAPPASEREREREREPAATSSSPAATIGTEARPAAAGAGQTGRFFMALLVGTGFGIASGAGEVNPTMHTLAQNGFAPAQLGHTAPEIGVFVTSRLLLSAQLRLQYVTWVTGQHVADVGCSNDYCEPSALAVAGFGRLAWLFGDGAFHALAGVSAGGGNIRHAQKFATDHMCGRDGKTQCVDSLASGPFLFGPSLEFLVELGSTLNLVLGVSTQIGVPKYTLNFDVNAGVAMRL